MMHEARTSALSTRQWSRDSLSTTGQSLSPKLPPLLSISSAKSLQPGTRLYEQLGSGISRWIKLDLVWILLLDKDSSYPLGQRQRAKGEGLKGWVHADKEGLLFSLDPKTWVVNWVPRGFPSLKRSRRKKTRKWIWRELRRSFSWEKWEWWGVMTWESGVR